MKNTKVSLRLNGWLNMLQEKVTSEGGDKPSHSDIVEDAILCRYPNIEAIKEEYDAEQERDKHRKNNVFKKLKGVNDTPSPDAE